MKAAERRKLRLALLRYVCEETGAHLMAAVSRTKVWEAGKRFGASGLDVDGAVQYLVNDGLIEWMGHNLSMTKWGIEAVEDEELGERPELAIPTTINVNQTFNAPVGANQVGDGNTANLHQAVNPDPGVAEKLAELRAAVEALEDAEDRADAEELLTELEAQAQSDQPRRAIVKATGEALTEKLPDVAKVLVGWVISWIITKAGGG